MDPPNPDWRSKDEVDMTVSVEECPPKNADTACLWKIEVESAEVWQEM